MNVIARVYIFFYGKKILVFQKRYYEMTRFSKKIEPWILFAWLLTVIFTLGFTAIFLCIVQLFCIVVIFREVAALVFSYIINLLMCRFSWSPRGSRCKLRVGKIFGLDTWIRRSFGTYAYHWSTVTETLLSKHMTTFSFLKDKKIVRKPIKGFARYF